MPLGEVLVRGADDQLTQCMPAELRGCEEDDNPPGVPWTGRFVSYKGVEGHEPECEIDLDVDYHACTCGAG